MRTNGCRMCFRYDIVVIEQDKEKVMELQKGHGDWDPRMTWVSRSHLIHSLDNMFLTALCVVGYLIWKCLK